MRRHRNAKIVVVVPDQELAPAPIDDEHVKLARLSLVLALRQVFASGLRLLGVSAPAKM
jgi:hypothetical protein